jgi:hypothetical protein
MSRLPEGMTLSQVDVWFQDEARVGQQGTVTRVWAEKGTRPRQVKQRQYLSAYVFGAICPANDQGLALVLPRADTAAMNHHLALISEVTPEGRIAMVVVDRAGWHMSSSLRSFDNVRLLPLPPASPELNPQEQVWQWLRDQVWGNRCFDDEDDILETCCRGWNQFCNQPGRIKSIGSRGEFKQLILRIGISHHHVIRGHGHLHHSVLALQIFHLTYLQTHYLIIDWPMQYQ